MCQKLLHVKKATGTYAYRINGLFEATEEFVGNASVLYRKVGDTDMHKCSLGRSLCGKVCFGVFC